MNQNYLLEKIRNNSVDCSQCNIRQLVLFSHLREEDFEHIHQPIKDVRFQQGHAVYREREQDEFIYTIRSGLVKLVKTTSDGESRIVRLLRVGDVIGLEALLGKPYQHTAMMLEPGEVCRIPVSVVKNLQRHSEALCDGLMQRWQKALDQADEWLTRLNTGQARQRVIAFIHFLESNSVDQPEFMLPSREDISAILGLTRETVSRIIASMKRDGELVDLGAGSFEANIKKVKISDN